MTGQDVRKIKFFNLAAVAVTAAVLTACGGGGGGTDTVATPEPTPAPTPSQPDSYLGMLSNKGTTMSPDMISAKFDKTGGVYVVAGGVILSPGSNITRNPDPDLKIFKINADGTGADVTAEILGAAQKVGGRIVIADFNKDGVDDIFVAGIKDFPVTKEPSVAFISQPTGPHKKTVYAEETWNHDTIAVDLDGDGDLDVLGSGNDQWLSDGAGNFVYRKSAWLGDLMPNGSGLCAGDFYKNGTLQIVATDLMLDPQIRPFNDTRLFEYAKGNTDPVAFHVLPAPLYDIGVTEPPEKGHDVRCRVADINNDNKLDIIVYSRPWDTQTGGTWTDEGRIQVLLNKGDWVFEDASSTNAISQYSIATNKSITYSPLIKDMNGDGFPEIWNASTGSGMNHVWSVKSSGQFTRVLQSELTALGADGEYFGMTLPVFFGEKFAIVYTKNETASYNDGTGRVYATGNVTVHTTSAKYKMQ